MSHFVIIRNQKGQERRVSQQSFDLMPKSQKSAWQVVGKALATKATDPGAQMRPENSFIPPEIEEATKKAAHEAELDAAAKMISGEPSGNVEEAPKAKAAPQAEEAPAPKTEGTTKTDALTALNGLTPKAAEALATVGITSLKGLVDADIASINKALESAGLVAKKAQVPNWKAKAASLIK